MRSFSLLAASLALCLLACDDSSSEQPSPGGSGGQTAGAAGASGAQTAGSSGQGTAGTSEASGQGGSGGAGPGGSGAGGSGDAGSGAGGTDAGAGGESGSSGQAGEGPGGASGAGGKGGAGGSGQSGAAGSGGAAGGGAAGGGAAGGGAAGGAGEGGAAGDGGGAGEGGASGEGGGGQGGAGGGAGQDEIPPTEAVALLAYLQAGSYKSFAHESAPHPSTGPHSGKVLTFVNAALDASLAAKNAEHPAGAASVKELYSGDKLSGWAVSVKTQATSDGGAGWYWYEILSTSGSPLISAQGPNFCSGCHSGGADHILIPYPLQ